MGPTKAAGEDVQREMLRELVEARQKIERLRATLAELVAAVEIEVDEKGGGGFVLARLSDARTALAETKS